MVLTFALCATFVFAQTATPRMKGEFKATAKAAQVQKESQSSIFTKDATPIFTCDFSADNQGYSTNVILGGLEGHAENYDYAFVMIHGDLHTRSKCIAMSRNYREVNLFQYIGAISSLNRPECFTCEHGDIFMRNKRRKQLPET